ncbi:MAG: hypothetical protein AAF850_07160 [Pseudomonadota bacterium]
MVLIRWFFSLGIGAFLIMFGVAKFSGTAHIFPYIEYKATLFEYPFASAVFPWLNYAAGALELFAGVLVIIPFTRDLGSKLAVLPFLGAVAFHLSPLLGVVTPAGYAGGVPPVDAISAGGPFVRENFSMDASPTLFVIAAVMLGVSIVNAIYLQRRF